jgi:hypothetical protein
MVSSSRVQHKVDGDNNNIMEVSRMIHHLYLKCQQHEKCDVEPPEDRRHRTKHVSDCDHFGTERCDKNIIYVGSLWQPSTQQLVSQR